MGTLLVLLLTLLAVADGWLLTFLVLTRASFFARLCYGAVTGLLALAWLSLLVSLLTSLNGVAVAITTLVLVAAGVVLCKTIAPDRLREALRAAAPDRWSVIYYLAWSVLLGWLFSRVVSFSEDGMHTAPMNNYGDLPFHFSVITSFAFGENLPPQNPIFHGLPFTYPFLIDFLTAFFRRAGADWPLAFFIENFTLAIALVGSIELLTMKLTGSRLAARLAPVIFLFNGGFGFIWFLRDLGGSLSDITGFLTHLPRSYTMNPELHLRWGNIFTTLLIPQRSLLFGLPLAAMIAALWWQAVEERRGKTETEDQGKTETQQTRNESPRRALLAAGALAGLMPMAHAHGFFSIILVSVPLALLFFSRDWLCFFIPAGALSLPQALWLRATPTRSSMFEWHPYWEAHDLWLSGQMSSLRFWLLNAGAFLALLTVALLARKIVTARVQRFYLPFLLCFILPNLVLLAPWAWDNIKVLLYWYLASVPLVAAVVAKLFSSKLITARIAAAALLITLTLSGAADVVRALSPIENVVLFSQAELDAAEAIRQQTPSHALMLNAPIHNSVVALTGRQTLMGYPGHLWTHGIDYKDRENDVLTIWRGGAEAEQLLQRYSVDYVIIGPVERNQFGANEGFFAARYQAVVDVAGYRVYRIRQ
ncbi:MAG TPA: hypothetical protein VNQ79_19045 [Blastocatellia bacterium]|nr:hypothetical protein [Blastocatellia bacterium]